MIFIFTYISTSIVTFISFMNPWLLLIIIWHSFCTRYVKEEFSCMDEELVEYFGIFLDIARWIEMLFTYIRKFMHSNAIIHVFFTFVVQFYDWWVCWTYSYMQIKPSKWILNESNRFLYLQDSTSTLTKVLGPLITVYVCMVSKAKYSWPCQFGLILPK